jgi:hypothetical protein
MHRFFVMACVVMAWAQMVGARTQAATITIDSGSPPVVIIDGILQVADADDFLFKIRSFSKAAVIFRSDGGSIWAAIRIGEAIRMRGFITYVPERSRCASACALAWLGGVDRVMGPGAQIGFHAAHDATSGQETGLGNALVGAYLSRIGLSYPVVMYITQAPPDQMTWLTPADAVRIGIDVVEYPPRAGTDLPATRTATPTPDKVPPASAIEQTATDFVRAVFVIWSAPLAQSLESMARIYSDEVLYHGKPVARRAVLEDKRRFQQRWPDRQYTIRPGTLAVRCSQGAGGSSPTCSIVATVDWMVQNGARRSVGTATIDYSVVVKDGGVWITAENSRVLQRSVSTIGDGAAGAGKAPSEPR